MAAFNHYDVDFGMGIPVLVRPGHLCSPNSILIMPGYPGIQGYEIFMTLTREVAAKTIQDEHWMSLVDRCDYDRVAEPYHQQQQQRQQRQRKQQTYKHATLAEPTEYADRHRGQLDGLGYAYAGCPRCLKKTLRVDEHWVCGTCKTEADGGSVGWTYRVGVYLVSTSSGCFPGRSGMVTGGREGANTASSVLGSVADAWFGCTAAQWVEMVSRDVTLVARMAVGRGLGPAIPAGAAEAESGVAETEAFVASHLAFSLAALVDGVSGVSGAYAGFDFKPAAPPRHHAVRQLHARETTTNRTVSRIAGLMSDDESLAPWFPTISVLWRFVVSESLCAIHRHLIASSTSTSNTNGSPAFAELEQRVKGLRNGNAQIAWGLSTPPSMAAISCMAVALEEPDTRHAEPVGSRDAIDTMHSMPHHTWEDLRLPVVYSSGRPQQQQDHHPASGKADTESDEMDELLDQCSQLLQSFSTTANLSACKYNGSAVAVGDDNDDAVSAQLFEESIHDDQLFSLYAGCSQQLFLLSQPSLFGFDKPPDSPVLFDTGKEMLFRPESDLEQDGGTTEDEEDYQYSTPPGTFMRALEDTPETVARDILSRNKRRQSGGLRRSRAGALHQGNEVLAPETPAAAAAGTPKRPRNHGLDPGSTSPSFWSPAGHHGPAIVPATTDRRGAPLLRRRSNTDLTTPSRAHTPKRGFYNSNHYRHRRLLTERASSMSGAVASARIPDPPPLLRLSVQNNAPSSPVVLAPETPVARSWAPRPLDLVASGDERRVRREQNKNKKKNK
ncbi:hypothetical protein IWW48_003560 [Coemansia sp. RSA 1200]|nr:hypothetical protein IWW48_003560 [Coemansia sp. RSA 1200]